MALESPSLSGDLARDPREVLRSLADYAQKYGSTRADNPEVIVYINSGDSLTGRVVGCNGERGTEFVLLQQAKPGEESDPSLIFLRLNDVAALHIRRASSLKNILSASASARSGEEPTKLQLKRQLEKISDAVKVEYLWPSTEEPANVRFGIAEAAQALEKVLKKIAADSIGSKALTQVGIIQIRHQSGAALTSNRKGKNIEIVCDLSLPPNTNLNAQLEKSVESAL